MVDRDDKDPEAVLAAASSGASEDDRVENTATDGNGEAGGPPGYP